MQTESRWRMNLDCCRCCCRRYWTTDNSACTARLSQHIGLDRQLPVHTNTASFQSQTMQSLPLQAARKSVLLAVFCCCQEIAHLLIGQLSPIFSLFSTISSFSLSCYSRLQTFCLLFYLESILHNIVSHHSLRMLTSYDTGLM